MEFWGIEVKPGETAICDPGVQTYLHISQVVLGETKKPSENVLVYLKVEGQEMVIGTLSGEKFPQASYDLVLEKDFQVFHSSRHTSIYVSGYKSAMNEESDQYSDFGSSESEDEPIPLEQKANGKQELKVKKAVKTLSGKAEAKADGSSAKPKANAVLKSETPKPEEDESDDDDDDDDDEDDDSASDDEDMLDAGDDSDEDEDEDDSSDEDVTPQKAEVGKKRASSASKTPVSDKKAKLVTPVSKKSDAGGKKGDHTATPYPKQAAKTSVTKEKQQTPKSGSAVSCKSCTKTFGNETALQSHTKAKHEAK